VTGLASVYTDRGDTRGASQLLEKLTAKKPSAKAFVNLANNYESMREFALAAEAYKKALELDPTHTELNQALARPGTCRQVRRCHRNLPGYGGR